MTVIQSPTMIASLCSPFHPLVDLQPDHNRQTNKIRPNTAKPADLDIHPEPACPLTTVDLLLSYLHRTDLMHDLQATVRQLRESSPKDNTLSRSVTTIRRGAGKQRKLSGRLNAAQVAELVATFETGKATRMQLAERYGISRTSVAKLLRQWREGKHKRSA